MRFFGFRDKRKNSIMILCRLKLYLEIKTALRPNCNTIIYCTNHLGLLRLYFSMGTLFPTSRSPFQPKTNNFKKALLLIWIATKHPDFLKICI